MTILMNEIILKNIQPILVKLHQMLIQGISIKAIMKECQLVGEKIKIKFSISLDHRINAATSILGHKPSTTQDLEANKPLEIDPIMGSIIEIGNKLNIDMPMLKAANTLIKLKAENLGLYKRSKMIDKITL